MDTNYFESDEFRDMHMRMCIDAWYDQFHGIDYVKPFEEIMYLHSNIEELERYILSYEKKYGTKLTYRLQDGRSYVSQIK